MPVERWRNPPDAALSIPQLYLLVRSVLMQTVGGVCDDSMNAVIFLKANPIEAVSMKQLDISDSEGVLPSLHLDELPLDSM
jgi:hypothetical protein